MAQRGNTNFRCKILCGHSVLCGEYFPGVADDDAGYRCLDASTAAAAAAPPSFDGAVVVRVDGDDDGGGGSGAIFSRFSGNILVPKMEMTFIETHVA